MRRSKLLKFAFGVVLAPGGTQLNQLVRQYHRLNSAETREPRSHRSYYKPTQPNVPT